MRNPVAAILNCLAHPDASRALRFLCWITRPVARLWHMAEEHGLNPWFFIAMSIVGYAIQSMIYLPPFQSQAWRLAFLIALRIVALVIPAYILLKGNGIARAFNGSIAALFILNTTWHVCYYVYL
jgi:archaellum biogenesis protein FlaJ (TadC family)